MVRNMKKKQHPKTASARKVSMKKEKKASHTAPKKIKSAKHTRYIIANWKMNPPTKEAALAIWAGIRRAATDCAPLGVNTVVCPPYAFLAAFTGKITAPQAYLGAQDVFFEQEGAFTGSVAAPMLASLGVTHVIVGHSERRIKLGESNEQVAKKVQLALAAGLTPILCVGEQVRDGQGHYLDAIRDQLKASLAHVEAKSLARLIIAYEPVWAIGKTDKDAMKPSDIHETKIFIRKVLADTYGPEVPKVPVLYGGSVSPAIASSIMELGEADGLLVGGKSLIPEEFSAIIRSAASPLALSEKKK